MRWAGLLLLLLVTVGAAAAQTSPLQVPQDATDVVVGDSQTQAELPALPAAQQQLAYSIIIENRTGGTIRMVEPPAQFLLFRPGIDLGQVVQPAKGLELNSYVGNDARAQQVVASSGVAEISLRLFAATAAGQGGFLLLLPAERRFAAADGAFEAPLPHAIYTDIPAGQGLFGGAYPLIAGNPVTAYHGLEHAEFDANNTAMTPDDLLIIEVRGPATWPRHMEIPNEPGGRIQLELKNGTEVPCGFVTQALAAELPAAGLTAARPGAIAVSGDTRLAIACPAAPSSALEIAPLGLHIAVGEADSLPRLLIASSTGFSPLGQPPLFNGFIYPLSGAEIPRRLPELSASVQIGTSTNWLPLAEIVVPEALREISALRIDWAEYDPQQAALEQAPQLEQLNPEPPPAELPGFRLGEGD